MGILKKILNKFKNGKDTIYIVSGLPRSGTSMMMKMLEAGGIKPFVDNIRVPDEDNPKGYYELERVKQLAKDSSWMHEAKGSVVKVISMLLYDLPSMYKYKVIFMQRNMDEILASQATMLERRGKKNNDIPDEELAKKFDLHLKDVKAWMKGQPNIEVIYMNYNELLEDPRESVNQINFFMNQLLDDAKMPQIIDTSLYRQRQKT